MSAPFTETEEEFIRVGVDGREDVPLPSAFRARTALDPIGACLVDNFRKSCVIRDIYFRERKKKNHFYISLYTLTGVVSGVASIAASGGEVPLLLLLGVGGAERGS